MYKKPTSSPNLNLLQKLNNFSFKSEVRDKGTIITVNDGIVYLDGLQSIAYGELIYFKENIYGLALNLEKDRVGAIVLGDFKKLRVGENGIPTRKPCQIGVGDKILGRVIDPLGVPLDGLGHYKIQKFMPVEKKAPSIIDRGPINKPLQTGIKVIDSIIPIGRGQRELIIGDRGTGKTALVIDTIINQKDSNVICVYVAIGQKRAKVAQVIEKLKKFGVLEKTVVVVASASDYVSLRYLAPFAGCAIGEYFMEKGRDVLVAYDDLSKHAWSYREISLLLKRPSGREAYPGDVFYLHSRILERACQLSKKLGGGSLTALPVIETQAGDISSYIPTNVISITDGQIYLESDLFFAGIRPALNVGLSVSRVGGAAQIKAMKKVAGKLKLDLSQYWELSSFAQFTTELDSTTSKKIERGKRVVEVLKQPQYQTMRVEDQIIVIYLAVSGAMDNVSLERIKLFEEEFLPFIRKKYPSIPKSIDKSGDLNNKTEKSLLSAIMKFKKSFNKVHQMEEEKWEILD